MKKNKLNFKGGFTLIELLVVIAIIGILSSVVLASLSNARNKGKDASVKSQLASMKAQGELYYSTAETYMGVCNASAEANGFASLLKETKNISGVDVGASLNGTETEGVLSMSITAQGAYDKVTCHEKEDSTDGSTSWAVEAPLSDSTSGIPLMYCVDSTGVSKITTSQVLAESSTVCQ